MGSGYKHYAGLTGSKEKWVGKDADIYQYTTPAAAIAASVPGDVIYITSGTYTLTATLTLNKPITVIGVGDVTLTGAVATALVAANVPAAGTTAVLITVKNIKFVNTSAGVDCLAIAQLGGSSGVLTTVWDQCGFTSSAGNSANILGNHATITCEHYFYGARHLPLDDDMTVDLDIAASVVHVSGYQLDGGETFICGTTNTAWLLELDNIVYSSAALTSGGNASLIINASNCSKIGSGAHTVVAVGDLDATVGSENIGLNTQAS